MLRYWRLQKGFFWGLIFGLKRFNQSDFQDGFNIPWILNNGCRFKSEPVVFVFFLFHVFLAIVKDNKWWTTFLLKIISTVMNSVIFLDQGPYSPHTHPKLYSSNQIVALYFCKELSKSEESFVVELAILSTFFLVLLLLQENKEMLKFWLFLRYCDKR